MGAMITRREWLTGWIAGLLLLLAWGTEAQLLMP
jgi:hypothetical protein